MPDASWDNSGLPPQQRGTPTWVKVLLGCGVVTLLLIGSCVGFVAWSVKKAATVGSVQWPGFVAAVVALQEPASTRTLYEANPGLKQQYPDAEAFEKQIALWRPAIQTPPSQMPPLTSGRAIAFGGKSTKFNNGKVSREHGTVTGYRMADDRMLVVLWRDGQILDIQFNRKDN